jgi:hypothetical protein
MTPLLRRIFSEKRPVLLAIGIAIVANVVLYALVVYPLGVRSAGAADRAATAANARQTAERELQVARSLITGKALADEELNAFYKKVLPANQTAARRLTYEPVVEIAERNNVEYVRRVYQREDEERNAELRRLTNTELRRLTTQAVFQGAYEDIRAFIYELETAAEFVIVDDVTVIEANESEPVTLTINLSTYFRANADGA